jgi:hypothetical protein
LRYFLLSASSFWRLAAWLLAGSSWPGLRAGERSLRVPSGLKSPAGGGKGRGWLQCRGEGRRPRARLHWLEA